MRYLLCQVGSFVCALPLDHVRETLRPLPTRALAGAPPPILGVAIIRGHPTPVVDLGQLLGVADARPLSRFVTLVVGTSGRLVALAVAGVLGVRTIERTTSAGLPPLLGAASPELLAAMEVTDQELVLILRVGHVIPDALWAEIAATP